MTSLMVAVVQERGAGVSEHADRDLQPLDYIAVFDERSRVEAEYGLDSLYELRQVSGAELLYPTEYVERESNANSTSNLSESVGALAPYCRQLEIVSFSAKVVLQ